MALFLLKPILWNTKQYRVPSGHPASKKSYPGMHGFGHEEWNNSERMDFVEAGRRYHAFHTEGVKKAPVDKHEGQVFVFMIASHDRVQQLVGVAGNATYLGADRDIGERKRLAKLLNLKSLSSDVWAVPAVRRKLDNDEAMFRKAWTDDMHWVPNWICPSDLFFWPDKPVTLDPARITGSASLPKMFSICMPLDPDSALTVMQSVPKSRREPQWHSLIEQMRLAPEEPIELPDVPETEQATTRLAMILARLGQERFRQELLKKWGRRCAVTGLSCLELLRASHIKPWAKSSAEEKLDPNNGLLLAAHLDALFDRGLISFGSQGEMLIAPRLPTEVRLHFNLPRPLLTRPSEELRAYLAFHRKKIFDQMNPK